MNDSFLLLSQWAENVFHIAGVIFFVYGTRALVAAERQDREKDKFNPGKHRR